MAAWHRPERASLRLRAAWALGLVPDGFSCPAACGFASAIPSAEWPSLPRPSIAILKKLGNVNPMSIDYACRPRLRDRLTPGGRTWPGKPWTYGGMDFHHPFRYSCLHSHSHALQTGFRPSFAAACNAFLPSINGSAVSVPHLVPIIFGAGSLDQ